jgi:hypothetical protein
MRHASFFAAAAAVALLGFAAPANATHSDGITECNETIETDNATVLLPGDLTCSAASVNGVTITADNVTLNLRGHTISAEGAGSTGVAVIASCLDETGTTPVPCFNTSVRNGRIVNFYNGVHIQGNGPSSSSDLSVRDPTVTGLDITLLLAPFGGPRGIQIDGDHHLVVANRVTFHPDQPGSGEGIVAFGNDVHIARNTITGNPQFGLRTDGNAGRFAVNEVVCTSSSGSILTTGIYATNYTGTLVVARNTVTGCGGYGINLLAMDTSPGGTQVRRNEVTANALGIYVSDAKPRIWCNVSNDNGAAFGGDGIQVGGPPGSDGGVVEKNTANRNNGYGINAPDATDGTGNTAADNQTNCTPNLVCTTPPDPACPAAGA